MNPHRRLAAVLLATSMAAMAPLFGAETTDYDHDEFDATMSATFRQTNETWPISLSFTYPNAGSPVDAEWMVEIISPGGEVVARKSGTTALVDGRAHVDTDWNGKDSSGRQLAPGYYTLRMRASPANSATSA